VPIGSFYPAQEGGPSNSVFWLCKYLSQHHEVFVITKSIGIKPHHKIVLNKWQKTHGLNIIYLNYKFHQFPIRFLYKSIIQIKKSDLIVLTSFFYVPSIILGIAARFYQCKTIWSPRGELQYSALRYNSLSKRLRLKVIKRILNNNFYLHSTSKSESENIKLLFENRKIIELPNYFELQEKVKIDQVNTFLFIGRIHSIKAIDNILRAVYLSEFFRKRNYTLIIAGKENEPGHLDVLKSIVCELNLEDFVEFVGPVSGNEKSRLYASSKFTLLLSHSENFGNVVVESLSQGTPVIASKGTPWKELELYNSGRWILNTPEIISNTLDELLNITKIEYENMRANAYNHALKRYDIKNKIVRWNQIINEITYE
jgi:glycosyltransferase involved in cell wall biosynthesis